mgnify:CR=1 FL=1
MKLEKWKNKWKEWSNLRKWQIWKLKLIDARLYFVSIFVGLLTGLVAVPYHYLLWYFFDVRKTFFTAHYPWYWHVLLFFILWGILIFVASLVKRMPLIAGGGIPQTRAANNGRIRYEHPFKELVAKFCGGVLALSAGLSLGREGPSVQIGSYIGTLISRWGHILKGERKQLLAAGKEIEREFKLLDTIEKLTPELMKSVRGSDKVVCANVDMYSGLVYRMLGIPDELFTPLFATARMVGWAAHRMEEILTGKRIIRPAYKAIAKSKEYVPLCDR